MPAHAIVGQKIYEKDVMKRPKYGERIKYLVIKGDQKINKVRDLVLSVEEFL